VDLTETLVGIKCAVTNDTPHGVVLLKHTELVLLKYVSSVLHLPFDVKEMKNTKLPNLCILSSNE